VFYETIYYLTNKSGIFLWTAVYIVYTSSLI